MYVLGPVLGPWVPRLGPWVPKASLFISPVFVFLGQERGMDEDGYEYASIGDECASMRSFNPRSEGQIRPPSSVL